MSIICKRGVSIGGCRSDILLALIAIEPIYKKRSLDLVVTSGSENYKHSAHRSAHYRGDAADIRSKNIPKADRPNVLMAIKRKLGLDYVVIHEGIGKPWEHFHIHWSPVFRGES